MDKIIKQIHEYVEKEMIKNDPAHDFLHVKRVVKLAKQIAASYSNVNLFYLEMIAYLHDMQDDKLESNHTTATLVSYLQSLKVEEKDIDFIIKGISCISFRKYPNANPTFPIEVQIVQDADRIDAIGAIGVARTFSYGGAHHTCFYGNEKSTIHHFEEKLLLLYERLNTRVAKEIAKERHDFLCAFYKQFLKEI